MPQAGSGIPLYGLIGTVIGAVGIVPAGTVVGIDAGGAAAAGAFPPALGKIGRTGGLSDDPFDAEAGTASGFDEGRASTGGINDDEADSVAPAATRPAHDTTPRTSRCLSVQLFFLHTQCSHFSASSVEYRPGEPAFLQYPELFFSLFFNYFSNLFPLLPNSL